MTSPCIEEQITIDESQGPIWARKLLVLQGEMKGLSGKGGMFLDVIGNCLPAWFLLI